MQQLKKMFATHPAPASDAGEKALKAIYAAAECSFVCTACADACLSESADMSACIRRDLDCAEICAAVARMLARPGRQDRRTLEHMLDACARACRACAKECSSHADRMDHCAICAETCRACADACDEMAAALV